MSLKQSIDVLSETSPRRFVTSVKLANLKIASLEQKLAEARAELAARPGAEPVPIKQAARPAAPAAATAPTGTDTITPPTLSALSKAVFGTDAATGFEAQRKQFTQAGLTVPGLEPAPANPHFTPNFSGLARTVRADRQAKIAAFFSKE